MMRITHSRCLQYASKSKSLEFQKQWEEESAKWKQPHSLKMAVPGESCIWWHPQSSMGVFNIRSACLADHPPRAQFSSTKLAIPWANWVPIMTDLPPTCRKWVAAIPSIQRCTLLRFTVRNSTKLHQMRKSLPLHELLWCLQNLLAWNSQSDLHLLEWVLT